MRTSTSLIALGAAASVATAQSVSIPDLTSSALRLLSSNCRTAVKELISPDSPTGQCLNTTAAESVLNSNGSIVPSVENWLDSICTSNPCSNSTLQNATQTILSQCSTDLQKFGLTNETVQIIVQSYPLAREVVCLKTTDPFTGNSSSDNSGSGGSGGAASSASSWATSAWNSAAPTSSMWYDAGTDSSPSPTYAQESAYRLIRRQDQGSDASATSDIASWTSSAASPSSTASGSDNSSSNSTEGTYCVTSLLDELSSYLGTELSLREIATIALGGNATAIQDLESIPPTALCNECIFGALSLVETEYPDVGTSVWIGNSTLNQFLDTTCNSTGLVVSQNGTLPENVTASAYNSSFPYSFVNGTSTYLPTSTASPVPIQSIIPHRNVTIGHHTIGFGNDTSSSATSSVVSTSGSPVSSLTSTAAAVTSAAASAGSAATSAASNPAAIKARWMGQQ
ncbi:hypothetical protein CNBG3790 [Cryptococcus deneoformans B-3501A]|uniref:hypothetical protein n=1 Tax=Cryptococcus deneoformans (strain B-3501A) TaxID=283643 RepID=UPI000042FF5F|nr:hypothetical protein CNBG3790 [Cryptococcus neoformans var. neoformans B-3501A]EAL19751.1 hypothetical protein CNBG3790 [Cryptococcus neoformans var. neoformans B-3501A]